MAEGFPDVPWQRKSLDTAALTMDDQLPRLPIDILQTQGGHFVGAQAQPGQEQNNGVIAPPLWTTPVDGLQQALDVLGRHVLGQSR
jgi:hypothetical protein